MRLAHTADGGQSLTIRLDPPELGHVQVRIDRAADTPAHVEITVEKSETLTLLLRDQAHLQQTLDQAGVPPEGRTVAFHVASPDPSSPRSETGTLPAPAVAAGGPSGDGSHGAQRQGGQPGQRGFAGPDDGDIQSTPIALPSWLRGGLDITA